VIVHQHASIINKSYSADQQLATALEERFIGNRGKQTQSDVVEESRVPYVCLPQFLHVKSKWTLWKFSFIIKRPYIRNLASEGLHSSRILSCVVV